MKKLWYKFSRLVIKMFGNFQLFPYPFFLILWGNTHYKVGGKEVRVLINTLKPGDIVLRRYDRYVSGWFIPGFWTHVGIMVSDKNIVHAISPWGVIEEDILTYLRTDHIKVLRVESEAEVKAAVATAPTLKGREYDFVFDTTDDSRLYCSELVKYCYPRTFGEVGKGTIPPDKLAEVGLKVIHDSKEFRKEG